MTSIATPNKSNEALEVVTFSLRREPTILEVADAEKYESYSEEIRLLEGEKHAVFTEPHNDYPGKAVYRFAVVIRVIPYREVFQIALRPGAGEKDLANGRWLIEKIKAGHFADFPWHEHVNSRGQWFSISSGEHVLSSEVRKGWFERCDDPGCVESMHIREYVDEEPMHVAESNDDMSVQVIRFDGAWTVSLNIGDDFSPEEAVSLANDLRWAAATAAKLNAPKAVA